MKKKAKPSFLKEQSWQLREAMLEAFFTFSPQQREIEAPRFPQSLYEDQVYGNWYNEWEIEEVAENLEMNWTEYPPSLSLADFDPSIAQRTCRVLGVLVERMF